MTIAAVVIAPDGGRVARASVTGDADSAEQLGIRAGDELLERGAGEILAEIQREHATVEGSQP